MRKTIQAITWLLLFLFCNNANATQLNGTYTINASGAATATNFQNFKSAIIYLTSSGARTDFGPSNAAPFGISGPVVFNVSSSTYNEVLSFTTAIAGLSSTNTISFNGTGQTTTIIQGSNAFTTSGGILSMSTTSPRLSNIKFNNIGFINTGVGSVAYLTDADNIRFNNCRFTSNTTQGFILSFGGTNPTTDSITNCTFLNGTEAIRFFDATLNTGAFVQSNTITGAINRGIVARGINGGKVLDNTVQIGTNATPAIYGIYLYGPTVGGAEVSRNKVSGFFSQSAINIDPGTSVSNKSIATNNSIVINGTNPSFGMSVGGNFSEIFHNTITVKNSSTTSAGFSFGNPTATAYSSTRIQNNLVQNTGGGYCVSTSTATFNSTIINFNNYYYNGSFCTKNNTTNLSLTGWKSIADANTKNLFTELNADGFTNNSVCISTSNVTTVINDIVGSTRSLTTPTIGAFEMLSPYANNATMDSVLSLNGTIASNVNLPLTFRIRNNGTSTISTFDVAFVLNGGPITTETFAASVNTCDSSRFTFIAPVNFSPGANQLKIYIAGVNSVADANPLGDTITLNILPALNGIYTINPAGTNAGTNFTSFAKADSALISSGVLGPVTFNVSAGTYNESPVITAFPNMGLANPVVFQPANGLAGSVIINSGTSIYAIRLNAVNNVQFKKINVRYTNSTAVTTSGFYVNNSKNILIDSCNVRDVFAGNASFTYAINSTANVNNTYSNNYLNKQFTAIQTNSDTASNFYNNRIVNSASPTVVITSNRNINFEKNYIDSTVSSNGDCIQITPAANSGTSSITRNSLLGNYGYSISTLASPSPSEPLLIANNFIYNTVNFNSSFYVNFYHNTIYLKSINSLFKSFSSCGADVRNCIFQLQPSLVPDQYNFFPLTNLGAAISFSGNNYSGTTAQMAIAKAKVLNYESLAKFENVIFPSAISPAQQKYYELSIPLIALVSNDFAGTVRHAITTKGAFEPILQSNDAGAIAMLLPNPASSSILGSSVIVKARVRNFGNNPINNISLRYSINGAAPIEETFTTTALNNFGDTTSFTFATTATLTQEINDIKFYPQLVNGLADGLNINDTLSTFIYTPMNGTFTINKVGTGNRNYKSFGEADSALITRGVNGAVVFNVSSGVYAENTTDLIFTKTKISGISAINNISFNGILPDSNLVTLTYSNVAGTLAVTLDSMSYISFRRMTFLVGISLANRMSNNITVENCRFRNINAISAISSINGKLDSAIVIRNCTFENTGITLSPTLSPLNSDYASLAYTYPKGILLENNLFVKASGGGGSCIVIDFSSAPIIRNNILNYTAATVGASNNYAYPIITSRTKDSVVITGNKIWGFEWGGRQTGTPGINAPTYAINITGAYDGSAKGIVANNYVQTRNFTYGLYAGASSGVVSNTDVFGLKVIHNTFRVESSTANLNTSNGGNVVDMSSNGSGAASFFYKNNIISIKYKGTATTSLGINFISTKINTLSNITNNSYFSDYPNHTFNALSPSINTNLFSAWQAAGYDANSYYIYPKFTTDSLNFHPSQALLMNAGTPVAGVNTDIEGESRSASTPDIGCDEFDLPSADAGVTNYLNPIKPFAVGVQPVTVKIKNYGAANLTSVQLNWTVNGILQTPYTWNGVVNFDSSTIVNIGTYNFPAGVGHNMVFWTSLPNNYTDTIYVNDTLKVNNVYAALNGIYTIGGTMPDFVNFAATIPALTNGGVTGPVTFRVRNGIYTEHITLKEYSGVSLLNPIVYESESGDSTLVTLRWTNNPGDAIGYNTVLLDSADYVSFKKISLFIGNYGPTDGNGSGRRAVMVKNAATNNSVQNCVLTSDNISNTLIADETNGTNKNDNLLIANNKFKGYFLYVDINGNATNKTIGIRIENNVLDSSSTTGMSIKNAKALKIIGHTLIKKGAVGTYGIYIQTSDSSMVISKNKIGNYTNGIYLYSCTSLNTAQAIAIANNMVYSNSYGIYSYFCNFVNIYNNSSSLNVYSSNSINVKNNILYFYSLQGNTLLTSNYNAIPLNATKEGVGYATLAAWRTGTSLDANSVDYNANAFTTTADYHIKRTFTGYDKKGSPIAGITDDIDGDVRDVTTPDIGADEYTLFANNANALSIVSPAMPFAAGSQNVQVRIRNMGENNLTSAVVKWFVNGVPQADYNYTGNLVTGDSATITLGSYVFNNFTTGDNLLIVTTLPNAVADEYMQDDSIRVYPLYPIFPVLCGSYTVGGSSPDFATPSAAIFALNHGGISCPVTFNIRNGNYVVADTITNIIGGSNINTVTFQSEALDSSKVALQADCNNPKNDMLYISNTNFINFKNLSFTKINGPCATNKLIVTSQISTANGRKVFTNNYFNAVGLNLTQSSFVGPSDSLEITNNKFDTASIFAYSFYGKVNISNNIGKGFSVNANGAKVFVINNSIDSGLITISRVTGTDSCFILNNTITSGYMSVANFTKGNISKNKISLKDYTFTTNALALSNTSDAAGNMQVDNNFIAVLNSNPAIQVAGISASPFYAARIWNNSVNMLNANVNSRAISIGNFSNLQLKNNSLINAGGGYAAYFSNNNLATTDTCNYNCYYTTGANIGYYGFTNRTNFAAWKTATGKDTRSINGLGLYLSNTNLHSNSADLNNAGGPIPQITTDIDNEPRSATTPDIGADEFVPTPNNTVRLINIISHHIDSISPSSPTSSVSFKFKNASLVPITAATFKLRINGIDTGTPTNWIGSLNAGDTSSIQTVGTFNFKVDSIYKIEVISTTIGDVVPIDDTARVTNKYAALNGIYTLGGIAPDFIDMARCLNTLKFGGYTGNAQINIRNGIYSGGLINFNRTNDPNAIVNFASESNDSSTVTLGAFAITNARSIRFSKVGFNASGSDIITLQNTKNISINNCYITGTSIGINSTTDTALIFSNNYILGTSLAIQSAGSRLQFIENNKAVNTTTDDAMLITNSFEPNVKNNVLDAGLKLDYVTSPFVYGNKITAKAKTITGFNLHGLIIDHLTGPLTKVINNAILVDGNNKIINGYLIGHNAFSVPSADFIDVYNNTVAAYNCDTISTVFKVIAASNSSVINIKNNNIAAYSGKAFKIQLTTGNTSDYNNFYVANDTLSIGESSTTAYANLAAYQATNPTLEMHSYSMDPMLMGFGSYFPINNLLDNKGTTAPTVLYDIDSTLRNAITPDIGCLEFGPLLKDVSIVTVVSPKLFFPEGVNPVKLLLRNNGTNTLTSATLKWKIDGVSQPDFNWTGSLPINGTDTVFMGNYNFLIKTDNDLLAWIENPNAVQDLYQGNDSIRKILWCGLSRTYIYNPTGIAQPGDDFNHPTQIYTQLYNGGIAAPAIIKIRSYQNVPQFYINNTPGASPINTLTFEPLANAQDSVRFAINATSSINNYAFVLYNSKYVRFNKLKFENTNTVGDYTTVLSFGVNSKNVIFDSCTFIAKISVNETSALAGNCNVVQMPWFSTQSKPNDSVTFKNSKFIGGAIGINTSGQDWFYNRARGLTVENCKFTNQHMGGITSLYLDSSTFINNQITTTIKYNDFKGIYISGSNYKMKIVKNKLAIAGDGVGIYSSFYGNYYGDPIMPSGQRNIRISNNFVQIGDTAAATRAVSIFGPVGMYHNSLNLTSTNANAVALEYTPDNGYGFVNIMEMKNNICNVDGPGIALKANETTVIAYSDYNDLYTKGSYVAQKGAVKYATRSNWYDATAHDLFSTSVNPLYYSSTNLHASAELLNNAAVPIANIEATDIDDEARSTTTPDIGADEFHQVNTGVTELVSPNSGCGLSSTEPIIVKVKNFGAYPQTNIPVAYKINSGTTIRDTITNIINAGDSLNFIFNTTALLNTYGSYNIVAWSELIADSLIANDTTHKFIYSTPNISSFPYVENFETNNGNYFTDGTNTSWAWGVIHSGIIDTAASGTKGWKTNLVGSYQNNELSYLHTPCFNLSGFTGANPWLWFSHAYALEQNMDKNWVEYSSDAGTTWTKLGVNAQGENWYDEPISNVWDTTRSAWHRAGFQIPLNTISNKTAVRFRFVLQTNGTNVFDGVAIDDVNIDTINNQTGCLGSTFTYTAGINGGSSYQWQADSGSGFANITDNAVYGGTTTPILNITNAANTFAAYKYRCAVVVGGVTNYSIVHKLLYTNTWTGNVNTDWFNIGNWNCGFVPDGYTDVIIPGGRPNYPVINSNADVRAITLQVGTTLQVVPGILFNILGN